MSDPLNKVLSETAARGLKRNQSAVRAIVIPMPAEKRAPLKKQLEDQTGQSKELPDDPFESLIKEGQVLESPFDLLTLSMLPEHSSELSQCIDAMVANIDGFGQRFIPRVKFDQDSMTTELAASAKKEKVFLENFFAYACLSDSFISFRKKLRKDLETTGNAWFEVIRGLDGRIQGFNHLPSYQMRLGVSDQKAQLVDMPVLEMQLDGSVEVKSIKVWRRFRCHAQSKATSFKGMIMSSGYLMRWFKDFGDPRVYNNETGYEVTNPKELVSMPDTLKANEVVHMKMYCARSPYGIPRYVGNLLAIFGDRASEEINYITFKNNNIPSMAMMVSNGQLTEATIKRIESFVESHIQGSDNYSKFLIIEAESGLEGEDAGQVKVDLKPLTKEQHVDELFQQYSKNNQDKVRRAFRLPPIFVGRSDDYSRATAETSRKLADEQVFAPEREEFDTQMNRIIFPAMGIKYHKFKSNSPNTTDNSELIGILGGAERTGGMTPRIARMILEDVLSIELPEFPKEFPLDVPFSVTMAEAVKNQAQPTEVGQQVTALKTIDMLTGADDKFIDRLIGIKEKLEKDWSDIEAHHALTGE